MTTSNQQSTKHLPRLVRSLDEGGPRLNILTAIIAVISFLGFLDASYLTAEHYFTLPLPCSLTHGCDAVLTSSYSTIAGIPVAFFGILYYLTILFCAVYLYTSEKRNAFVARLIFIIISLGILAYLGFIYLQLFVIHALCIYCLGSAALTLLLFILSILLEKSVRNEEPTVAGV